MAPKSKKARRDQCTGSSSTNDNNNPPSGVIRFEVDVNDITDTGILSPVIEVMGMPWELKVQKLDAFIAAFLMFRESGSNMWSIDVAIEICLINSDNSKNSLSKSTNTLNHDAHSLGFRQFHKWEDVIDEEKGFIKDNKITVEARFTLSNIKGIGIIPRIDFTDENDPCHDLTLIIDGKKIHVNKSILAVHSPVFKAMFFGNSDEKDKKEIELKEVDYQEFIQMLNMIYPSYQKITDANAEALLKIADLYQIQTIIDQVEQFFIDSTSMCIRAKLRLSDQYRLVKLQGYCIGTFKTTKDITDLQGTAEFKALSNDAKAALLLKLMENEG